MKASELQALVREAGVKVFCRSQGGVLFIRIQKTKVGGA